MMGTWASRCGRIAGGRFAVVAGGVLILAATTQAQWLSTDRVAAAYFFYWYDVNTGLHFRDPDGSDAVTHHPPDSYLPGYTYTSVAWFERELEDMLAARVDVVLPDYWGNGGNAYWARPGLDRLVQAAQQLAARGVAPPRIGLFLDTNALLLENGGVPPNLTTQSGKDLLFASARDFFDRVPDAYRATVDGRLLVVFYTAGFVGAYDAGTLADFSSRLQSRYGKPAYLVLDQSWKGVAADGVYPWGVALFGPSVTGNVGSLGPGFDETATYGRTDIRIRDRRCGEFYLDGWDAMAGSGARLVLIETWNELHEGTEIAPTREFGRTFVDLTAAAIGQWKRALDLSSAERVWVDLAAQPHLAGVRPALNHPDGAWKSTFVAGREAVHPDRSTTPASYYIYLDVADEFYHAEAGEAWVTVEYLDDGSDAWWVDYDGTAGPFTSTGKVNLGATGAWKRHTLHLPDAYFGGRQFEAADLRLCDGWDDDRTNTFGRVWVSRRAPALAAPDLLGGGVVRLAPGAARSLPLAVTPGGSAALDMELLRGTGIASLGTGSGGRPVLHLAPQPCHTGCSFRVVVRAADATDATLADTASYTVEVGAFPVRRHLRR